ncbi:Ycf66 family protein [Leptodesmis sp.]|uniref:Ycf66 family protein n=1 Tax=Leptodesmis sp. TaxID=3100501 RepID=UPI00405349CE
MLAYILAIGVGLGSFAMYMAAFFFPEVHRRNDFIWSGIGLFYALVLWIYAPRITGGLLLGQMAGVALLSWLGWQTFWLRRQAAPLDQQTPIPAASDLWAGFRSVASSSGRSPWVGQISRLFEQVKEGVQAMVATTTQAKSPPPPAPTDTYTPPSLEEFGTAGQEAAKRFARVKLPDSEATLSNSSKTDSRAIESARATRESAAARSSSTVAGIKEKGRGRMAAAARKQAISPQSDPDRSPTDSPSRPVPAKSANRPVGELSSRTQSLFKGFSKQKESKPVYVRKQYREAMVEVPETQKAEIITPAPTGTGDSVNSHAATLADVQVEVVAEVVSEELVPDLLGNPPYEVTAAEIVEELLEDISAQEARATPSNLMDSRVEYETVELPVSPEP